MWTMPNTGEIGKSVETLRFAEMLSSFAQIPGDVDSAAWRQRAILPAKGEVTDAVRKQYSDLKKKEGAFAGETAPNPEQLILLSKQFDISIDELVGNDAMSSGSSRENKSIKDIYIGLIVLCCVGACLGRVIHGILMYLQNDKKKQKISEAHCVGFCI